MALSISEIEIQSAEYLPSRELMSALSAVRPTQAMAGPSDSGNGIDVHDIVSGIDVKDTQLGLVNLLVHHVDDAVDVGTANA